MDCKKTPNDSKSFPVSRLRCEFFLMSHTFKLLVIRSERPHHHLYPVILHTPTSTSNSMRNTQYAAYFSCWPTVQTKISLSLSENRSCNNWQDIYIWVCVVRCLPLYVISVINGEPVVLFYLHSSDNGTVGGKELIVTSIIILTHYCDCNKHKNRCVGVFGSTLGTHINLYEWRLVCKFHVFMSTCSSPLKIYDNDARSDDDMDPWN